MQFDSSDTGELLVTRMGKDQQMIQLSGEEVMLTGQRFGQFFVVRIIDNREKGKVVCE